LAQAILAQAQLVSVCPSPSRAMVQGAAGEQVAAGGPGCCRSPSGRGGQWAAASARNLARRLRRARAAGRGPLSLGARLADIGRGLSLHADLDFLNGEHHHCLGRALAAARPRLAPSQRSDAVLVKRARDMGCHAAFEDLPGPRPRRGRRGAPATLDPSPCGRGEGACAGRPLPAGARAWHAVELEMLLARRAGEGRAPVPSPPSPGSPQRFTQPCIILPPLRYQFIVVRDVAGGGEHRAADLHARSPGGRQPLGDGQLRDAFTDRAVPPLMEPSAHGADAERASEDFLAFKDVVQRSQASSAAAPPPLPAPGGATGEAAEELSVPSYPFAAFHGPVGLECGFPQSEPRRVCRFADPWCRACGEFACECDFEAFLEPDLLALD